MSLRAHGLRAVDHVGLTVPDLDQAVRFLVDVVGATELFRHGPYEPGPNTASHFGREPIDYQSATYAGDAATALAFLDEEHARWVAGVEAMDPEDLAKPVGPAEGPFAEHPYAELILHINREAIHHGAEILLLRDLYRHRPLHP